jgi:hypothetical protein
VSVDGRYQCLAVADRHFNWVQYLFSAVDPPHKASWICGEQATQST